MTGVRSPEHAQDFVECIHRAYAFDLHHTHQIRVVVVDQLRECQRLIVGIIRRQAVAFAKSPRAANTTVQLMAVSSCFGFSVRGNMMPPAPQSRARATSEYWKSATRTMGHRFTRISPTRANIVHSFPDQEIAAVLCIDKGPVQTGGSRIFGNPRRNGSCRSRSPAGVICLSSLSDRLTEFSRINMKIAAYFTVALQNTLARRYFWGFASKSRSRSSRLLSDPTSDS